MTELRKLAKLLSIGLKKRAKANDIVQEIGINIAAGFTVSAEHVAEAASSTPSPVFSVAVADAAVVTVQSALSPSSSATTDATVKQNRWILASYC